MTKVVGVRFKDTGKTYYFDPKGLEIKKGDLVVVETARGMECGVAQYAPKEVAENEVTAPLKPPAEGEWGPSPPKAGAAYCHRQRQANSGRK